MSSLGVAAFVIRCVLLGTGQDVEQETVREFFVSPGGEDGAPGSLQAPLRSLARARDAVREWRARAGPRSRAAIVLRGGTHALDRTLVLGPQDSDTLWRAYEHEVPLISGGRRLETLGVMPGPATPEDVGRASNRAKWVAELAPDDDRRQLFVDGARAPRVRLPREGFFQVAELPDVTQETPWHAGQTRFRFASGDLREWWRCAEEAEIVALHFWVDSRLPIASIDAESSIVELSRRSVFRLTDDHSLAGARYFVENVIDELERPGEWATCEGKLWYLPTDEEIARGAELVVPRLERLVSIEGDPDADQFVEDLAFRGLAFAHTLALCPPTGWPSSDVAGPPQAAVSAPGAIHAIGAHRLSLEGCRLEHLGGYALELGAGCQDVSVKGCEIGDLGAGGLKIGETSLATSEARTVSGIEVLDCRIHHGGLVFPSAIGGLILHASHCRIAHDEIDHFAYTGVSVGWSWGYGESGAFANTIDHCHIHHIGQGLLSDMGGIYTLGVSPGTALTHNLIHDVESHGYGGWGIYFDEGTTGVLAEDNVVYRCKSASFHQHYGKENVVRNNVFAFAREAQIARTRAETHRSFTFEHNIVVWSEGAFLSGNFDGEGFDFERNVYWDTRGGFTLDSQPGGLQYVDCRVVDPLFVDAAHDDFRLRPDSPALALGIHSVDLSDVGPRAHTK